MGIHAFGKCKIASVPDYQGRLFLPYNGATFRF